MVGKNTLQISGNEFAQGLTTSDFLGDGGIGTSSYNLSMIAQPGVIRAMPISTPTKNGAAIAGGIVASCETPEIGNNSHNYRWFVDNSGSTVFTCDDSSYVDQVSSLSNISSPNSDMVTCFGDVTNSYIYISGTTNITEVKVVNATGNYTSADSNWWSGTVSGSAGLTTGVPHPELVFEGSFWVGDANILRSATTRVLAGIILTLNTNERIQCLAIEPATGLMMVGVRTTSGNNDTFSNQSFVYLYDGYSSKARRKIPVDGRIASFRNVGGQVFVGMDNTIGVWNGNGVTFLRRLANVGQNTGLLPYKNHITSFQNTLLVCDGQYILAYGDIGNGKKVWWPFYKHPTTIAAIFFIGNQSGTTPINPLIAVNDGSTLLYIRPMDVTTGATGAFYTNNINFQRPVDIRRIRVFTTGVTTTAGIGSVSVIDDNNVTYSPTQNKFVVASGTKYVFDFDFNYKLQTLQPLLTIDTQAFGITKVVIYYDVAE